MPDQKERESILLKEARKLRELLDRVIARLESGEPGASVRNEIDDLKRKIVELLQGMEGVRVEDIMEDVRKKFQDVLGKMGSSLDEVSQKAHGVFDWFGKDALSREEVKKIIMSEDLTAEYFRIMRGRNWADQGIQESLDVLRQILLSRI